MESEKIEKLFKTKKTFLIITFISLVVTVVLVSYVVWKEKTKINPKPIEYYDLAIHNAEKEYEYVTVTIEYICSFARKEDYNFTYYFIVDENDLIYIARISDETYKKIEDAYNEQQENFSYELEGYIFNIESDVKNLAIETLGTVFENLPTITKENYEEYLGKTYLDEHKTPNTQLCNYMILISIVTGVIAITFGYRIIKVYRYTKTSYFEDLKYELEKNTSKYFEKERIYLTDNYIVSNLNNILRVNRYEDFIWIYISKLQQYGSTANIFVRVKTKNKKQYDIASSLDENKLNEIIDLIKQKNTNILVGFTTENRKQYKNICRENKK